MASKPSLEKQWKSFCLKCFGDISEQQYIDLKRTFFGGAAAMFAEVMNMLDPGLEPTEEDLKNMTSLQNELHAFNEEVKAGRA